MGQRAANCRNVTMPLNLIINLLYLLALIIQILRELKRVCALIEEPDELYYQRLDSIIEVLLQFFSRRTGQVKQKMQDILDVMNQQVIKIFRFKLFRITKSL